MKKYSHITSSNASQKSSDGVVEKVLFSKQSRYQKLRAIVTSSLMRKYVAFFLYYLLGVVTYNQIEGWDVLHSVFYLTATVTTVGFGDLHPTHNVSKVFTIFFILFGVPIVFGIALEISSSLLIDCQSYIIMTFMDKIYGIKNISTLKMKHYRVYLSIITILTLQLSGALFFSGNEGWSFLDGVYFSTTTLAGVGYGDIILNYHSSLIFGIFFILIGACLFATAGSNIFDVYYKRRDPLEYEQDLEGSRYRYNNSYNIPTQPLTEEWVDSMIPANGDATIPTDRLVIKVLLFQGIAMYKDDIEPIARIFDLLRQDSTTLTRDDLINFMKRFNEEYCPQEVVNPMLST